MKITTNNNSSLALSQLAWLLGLIVIALLLDWYHYSGFNATIDDTEYFLGAYRLLTNDPNPYPYQAYFGGLRLGMILPIAITYWLSSGTYELIALPLVAYHPALVILTFLFARKICEQSYLWILAATFVATSPLLYIFCGSVLPDGGLAFWLTLSMYFLIQHSSAEPEQRRTNLFLILAGVSCGIAYCYNEKGLIFVVPALFAVLVMSRDCNVWGLIKKLLLYMLGLMVVFAVEGLAHVMFMDVPLLARFRLLPQHAESYIRWDTKYSLLLPWDRLIYAVSRLKSYCPLSLSLMILSCVALVIGKFKRKQVSHVDLILVFGFIWYGLYTTFGTTSFSSYVPPTLQQRYYLPLIPVGVLLLARTIEVFGILNWKYARRTIGCLTALIVLVEVAYSSTKAGQVFDAPWLRSVIERVALVRDRYPNYKIVLNTEQSLYVMSYYVTHKPKNLIVTAWPFTNMPTPELPALPFLFLNGPHPPHDDWMLQDRFKSLELLSLSSEHLTVSQLEKGIYLVNRRLWRTSRKSTP